MKWIFNLMIFCIGVNLFSQTKGINPIAKIENGISKVTRAVVVGISDYQNDNITDLQFADKDALLFAEYLKTREDNKVKPEHLTLLTNENATAGKFISALYGLIEESKEGDEVILYFSGHGDVESNTISQPGFLLCWDAPSKIYMSGGTFSILFLQEIIATLSIQNKSKVTIFTDACRAGKLAGNAVSGTQATAANLSKQFANEVKVLSCQPNEYSIEGINWGGGRGVFSYYLIAGLQGMADRNNDGEVTLAEISRYLEDNVTESAAPHQQTPLIIGDRNTKLNKINAGFLTKLKEEMKGDMAFFSGLSSRGITNVSVSDTSVQRKYKAFNKALEEKNLLTTTPNSAWNLFNEIKDAIELKPYLGLMKRNLAAALQDDAQQAINLYLAANAKELRNRYKYNKENYNKYSDALKKAASLIGENHFYYKTIMSRALYFEGLAIRLDGEKNEDEDKYVEAISLLNRCLSFDSTSAFALNEKGYILYLQGKYPEALQHFDKALLYSPSWALTYSNKAAVYNDLGQADKAIELGKQALKYDSTLIFAINNMAVSYYKLKEYNNVKKILNYGLTFDSTYSNFYSILGLASLKQNEIEEAKMHFLKAYSIDSTILSDCIDLGQTYLKLKEVKLAERFFLRAKAISPMSELAMQGMIEYYLYINDLDNAGKELEVYVVKFPQDYFAFYQIASLSAKQGNVDKCYRYLEQAFIKGFDQWQILHDDENFHSIKESETYKNLLQKYNHK